MKKVLVIVFCTTLVFANGKDLKYPVSEIPEDMKANADAVIRDDRTIFTILARDKAESKSFFAITILNDKAKRYAQMVMGYDKHRIIKGLKAAVYDANGKLIKRLKDSEIYDQSAFDGFSLFTDNRLKAMDLTQAIYPYTVEFEVNMDYRLLYAIDGSLIVPAEKVSVQHSYYQLIFPPQLRPRIKTLNLGGAEPLIQKMKDGSESMSWTFENLKSVQFEPLGPHPRNILPQILAAPVEFEYDGYAGNMSTWEDYGKWNQLLNKGRDQLSEAARQKVKELTKDAVTTEQKAKAIYEYLQSRTRYVSIQLGIGGLQPFEADVVDKTGYGDCKALSNYMVAMLKEAGVHGIYTTVMAGRDQPPTLLDFPSHQSNHVIVAVPNGADTLWLECTSQTTPFGYQGTFTGDRKALMITEEGGKIVNTLRYTSEQNKQSRTADVFVDNSGSATAKITTTYAGLKYESGGLHFVVDRKFDDQKKWVQNNTGISTFDINSFSMSDHKDKIPSAVVNIDLKVNRLATVSGKRLFLTPNLMNRSTFLPSKVEKRTTNVLIRGITHTDIDSIRFHLPENLYPEFLPEPVRYKSRFGEYETMFKMDQGTVIYIRKMITKNGEFPAESYKELVEFYQNVNNADNMKLVFLNKT